MDLTLFILALYVLVYYFTLSYLSWTSLGLLGGCYAVFVAYTAKRHGEMASDRFRRSGILNFLRRYFAFELEGLVEAPKEPVIYASYPHGILPINLLVGYGLHGPLPRLADRVVISPHFFRLPIVRELCLYGGAISSHGRTILQQLQAGHSVILTPEGARGVLAARNYCIHMDGLRRGAPPGQHDIIKFAWSLDTPLVPVFTTGEEKLFWTDQRMFSGLRHFMIETWGYCFPLFGIGPFPAKVVSHIGAKVVPHLTPDDTLESFRNRFIFALATLIDTHTNVAEISVELDVWLADVLDQQ